VTRGIAACASALLLSLALAACGEATPPRTITDSAFVKQANTVCKASIPQLRAPERKATSTTDLRPENLEHIAAGLERVTAELRAIDVQAGDKAEVDAWLANWDRFVAVGRKYAAAVKANDQERFSKIDDEAIALTERIGKFARGNGITDCIL
jgi:hypothetical protein